MRKFGVIYYILPKNQGKLRSTTCVWGKRSGLATLILWSGVSVVCGGSCRRMWQRLFALIIKLRGYQSVTRRPEKMSRCMRTQWLKLLQVSGACDMTSNTVTEKSLMMDELLERAAATRGVQWECVWEWVREGGTLMNFQQQEGLNGKCRILEWWQLTTKLMF